ncbi:hypothetical protein [Edaphobacillus lindanitolerans]|uniref:Uncharacterized protein n=1 Tax=Edaphobacillus lindanitolerans TaxID=550447 RepID=A0A1U7PR32_9BACI|nr:hypothetical protein [Edaphobacillus lindanitolerans]SIT87275.1 hypothetical protein SAMN05428946_2052 [Edaphobacillus lindanitolerans]
MTRSYADNNDGDKTKWSDTANEAAKSAEEKLDDIKQEVREETEKTGSDKSDNH